MNILGINPYHGDASACLVRDGRLIAAAEEERFNRIKHCAGLPFLATRFCLETAGLTFSDIDVIAISRDPRANFGRKALYALRSALTQKNFLRSRLATLGRVREVGSDLARHFSHDLANLQARGKVRIEYVEHHLAHMASSFFVSPFEEAALLSIDGFGDFVSTKIGVGRGNTIETLGQVCFPHSAGILYTATSQFIGFPKYGDEGKVMGLAPYGKPIYIDKFDQLIRLHNDFSFSLNLDYFRHHDGSLKMSWIEGSPSIDLIFSEKYQELFGPARKKEDELTQYHIDIAASLQAKLEQVYFHIVHHLQQQTGASNLCISGGVALNSVCNGKLFLKSKFKETYIQPAAGDGGTCVGAAYYVWNQLAHKPRGFVMEHAYTGPHFDDGAILKVLETQPVQYKRLDEPELYDQTAKHIANGEVVGWFQGGMEFGPRALGNRSIVADPRRADMKDILNSRIKHREAFRPFAPSVLAEATAEFFTQSYPSPFMLMVYDVLPDKRPLVPAITHVDGTGRLQTVREHENPRYYRLIQAFKRQTHIPMVLNTSFNENEPIVCTPQEALNCFLKTKMDVLVLGNYIVSR